MRVRIYIDLTTTGVKLKLSWNAKRDVEQNQRRFMNTGCQNGVSSVFQERFEKSHEVDTFREF